MNKFTFFIILLFFQFNSFYSQNVIPFEIVSHELGGDEGAGMLIRVNADSQYIYVLGHLPKTFPGSSKQSHPVFGSISYDGTLKNVQILVDSTISESHFDNSTMIQKNDSIYLGTFYIPNPESNGYSAIAFFEVDMRNAKIIKRKKFYNTKDIKIANIYSGNHLKDSLFQIILETFNPNSIIKNSFLYEFDINLNIKKSFQIQYGTNKIFFRWVSSKKNGEYDIIVEDLTNLNTVGSAKLTYLKVDTFGQILKKKDLPISTNFELPTAEIWTIIQESDGSFVIGCMEEFYKISPYLFKPYIIKVSPEFDSIYWQINYYPFDSLLDEPELFLQDLVKLKENSGYLLCGDWLTPELSKPDYGLIMKASLNGDSLWTHKYAPIGWDSLRALAIKFQQMTVTPYNTVAIAASISDKTTGWWHPWVLHIDADGCLIPNCNKAVKTEEILKGKENGFEIKPTIIEDKIIILSHISMNNNLTIRISSIDSKILYETKFKPEYGVQYILEKPQNLKSGEYIMQIFDKNIIQTEKIFIN